MVANAETVKRAIRTWFRELPVPGSIIDTEIGDRETRETFRAALGGRRWSEIATGVLSFHHDALCFLSPAGFRYLLPAFMIAALESPSSPILDVLVDLLTRPDDPQDERTFLERMSPLTEPQRAAVRAFLEFLRDEQPEDWPDDEPGKALREYWTREGTA